MNDRPAAPPAAHAPGLRRSLALFEDAVQARIARDLLVSEGLPPADIEAIGGPRAPDRESADIAGPPGRAGWEGLGALRLPAAEARDYARALGRGCVLLAVRHVRERHRRVLEILESFELVDLDEGAAPAGGGPATGAAGGVIQVVEERLALGKRRVEEGRVRVRAYAVERPVEARVVLREERLRVERRPVGRVLSPAEVPPGAFEAAVVEVRAHAEEAVAAKSARVVEEISIRHETSGRTERVRARLRKTEVEVEETGQRPRDPETPPPPPRDRARGG